MFCLRRRSSRQNAGTGRRDTETGKGLSQIGADKASNAQVQLNNTENFFFEPVALKNVEDKATRFQFVSTFC